MTCLHVSPSVLLTKPSRITLGASFFAPSEPEYFIPIRAPSAPLYHPRPIPLGPTRPHMGTTSPGLTI